MSTWREDGRLLWRGLLDPRRDVAASCLAFLEETTFANRMAKKGRSLVMREDEFAKTLKKRTDDLNELAHAELNQLFTAIKELGQAKGRYRIGGQVREAPLT